jgi:hypothetical protein
LRYCANQTSARNNGAKNILSFVVAVLVQIKTVPRNSTLCERQCGVVAALPVTAVIPSAAAGRFIGFVAALYINDFIRRTTCSGNFIGLGGLGGPGIVTPQCSIVHESGRKKHP